MFGITNLFFSVISKIYLELTYFIYDTFKIPYFLVICIFVALSLISIYRTITLIQTNKNIIKIIIYAILSINFAVTTFFSLIQNINPTKTDSFIGQKLNTEKVQTTKVIIPKNKILKYSTVSNTLTYVDSHHVIQKLQLHIDNYKLISKKDSPKIEFTQSIYQYHTSYRNIKTFIIHPNDNKASFGDGTLQNHFDTSTQSWINISNVTMYVSKSDYNKYSE